MTSRDRMKILEFGADEKIPQLPRPGGGHAMKIVEFGDDSGGTQKEAAIAKDIGHIKILEFDDDVKTDKANEVRGTDRPRKSIGAIKIKAFDEDTERAALGGIKPGGAERKMKILEFD